MASNETHHPRSYARDNGNINSTHAEATYSRSITTTTRSHHSQTAEYEGDTGNIYPPNLRSFDKFRQLSVVPATSLASEETFEPLFSESETAEMQTDRNLNGRNVKERNRRTPGLGNMEAVNRDGSHTGPGYPTDRRHSRSLYTDKRTSAEMVECTPEADEELYEADGSVRYDSDERADERADERMGSDTRAHSATEFPPCRQPVATPEDFTDSGTSPSHAPSGSYPEAPADVPCLFRYADHHGRVECIRE